MSGSFQFHVQDSGRGFQPPGSVLMDVMDEDIQPRLWIFGEKYGENSILSAPFLLFWLEKLLYLCSQSLPNPQCCSPIPPVPPVAPFLLHLSLRGNPVASPGVFLINSNPSSSSHYSQLENPIQSGGDWLLLPCPNSGMGAASGSSLE